MTVSLDTFIGKVVTVEENLESVYIGVLCKDGNLYEVTDRETGETVLFCMGDVTWNENGNIIFDQDDYTHEAVMLADENDWEYPLR